MAAVAPGVVHIYRKLATVKLPETAVGFIGRRAGSDCSKALFPAFTRRCLSALGWGAMEFTTFPVYDETTARGAMSSVVAWWLDNGAPPAMGRVLRAVRGAVLERLLPRKGSGPRTFGWWYLGALLSFTELVCLCRGPLRRNKCRLALRCLPPGLHACLLARDFSSPFWQIQWRGVLAGFHPCADKASGNLAVVYVLADAKSGLYYVGKSCSSRTRGGQQWPGAVVRFSEHLLGSFDPVYRKRAPEDRYKVWRRSKPHYLIFIPLVWAENSCVDRLESLIIRTAAPPTQSFLKVAPRARPRSRRGWPRFREPLSAHGEVASNALLALGVDRSSLACRMWLSWKQWAAQWLATSGKPIWQLEVLLYTPEYEEALVVRLGEARARLDYERLWRTGGTEKACRLWTTAARLPTRQRRRARDKLSRFLRGYIAVRAPVLRLPATSSFQVAAVRRAIRQAIAANTALFPSKWHARVCIGKMRLRRIGPRGRNDMLLDHHKAAADAKFADFTNTPERLKSVFRARADCVKPAACCTLPVCFDKEAFLAATLAGTSALLVACGLDIGTADAIAAGVVDRVDFLRQDPHLEARKAVTASIRRGADAATPRHASDLCERLVAAPVVRDIRRRVFCSRAGYCFRLFSAFEGNPTTYIRQSISVAEATANRTAAAKECFATAKLALASELALPMAYYLPKSKCFGGDGGAKFQCDRPHEHERIIIAAPTDGINRFMRKAARALSAVAKASGLHSLSVRKLNEAVREIEEANGRLDPATVPRCCACDAEKAPLCACKIDAASFFTKCNRSRAVEACRCVLRNLRHRGCNGVSFHPSSRQQDTVTGRDKLPNRAIFTFALIECALSWLENEGWFRVGDTVYLQAGGLAQGSPMSPVLARFELDVCHNRLFRGIEPPPAARRITRRFGRRITQWLAGKLHVDDALFWSRVACHACLAELIRATWPADIGFSLEGVGPRITFLHLDMVFGVGPTRQSIAAAPRMPNAAFGEGDADVPAVRVASDFMAGICRRSDLYLSLVPKLWLCAESFSSGAPVLSASRTVVLLCCELLRSSWPPLWISGVLLEYKNFRRVCFTAICQKIGLWLRRNRDQVGKLATAGMSHQANGWKQDWQCLVDDWSECINCLPAEFWH